MGSGLRRIRYLAGLAVLIVGSAVLATATAQHANAQQNAAGTRILESSTPRILETPSQRVLEFPDGGRADVRQQMQLLQQLRSLLEPMGQQLPDLDQLAQNPQSRQMMRELLQQYARTRTLPPAGAGADENQNAVRLPIPSRSNSQPGPNRTQEPRESSQQDPRQQNEQGQQNQPGQRQQNGLPVPPDHSDYPDRSQQSPVAPDSGSERRASGLERRTNNLPGTGNGALRNESFVPDADLELPDQRFPDSSDADAIGPQQPQPNRAPASPDRVSRPESPPFSRGLPENSGFPRPEPQFHRDDQGHQQPGRQDAGPVSQQPPSAARQPRAQIPPAEPRQTLDVRQELSRSGLRGTLQKIVDQAKKQTEQDRRLAAARQLAATPDAGEAVESAGLADSLVQALDGIRQDLLSSRLDHQENNANGSASPESANRQTESAGQRSFDASAVRESVDSRYNGQAGSSRRAISDFFSQIASAPAAPSGATGRAESAGTWTPVPGTLDSLLFAIALPLIVAGLLFVLLMLRLKPFARVNGMSSDALPVIPLRGRDIRSREDVILAFHQLVAGSPGISQLWWTHRTAAAELAEATPAYRAELQTLADVYEHARYLPAERGFPEEQIVKARSAMERCESCPI